METNDSNTNKPKEYVEQEFVLKMELGMVFPVRAKGVDGEEGIVAKSQKLADMLVEHIRKFDIQPEIMQILNGEAMDRDAFEQLKDTARQQAAALARVLQGIAGANDGMDVGPTGLDDQVLETSAGDDDILVEESALPGAMGESIEPSDGTFRAPGSRTLN